MSSSTTSPDAIASSPWDAAADGARALCCVRETVGNIPWIFAGQRLRVHVLPGSYFFVLFW